MSPGQPAGQGRASSGPSWRRTDFSCRAHARRGSRPAEDAGRSCGRAASPASPSRGRWTMHWQAPTDVLIDYTSAGFGQGADAGRARAGRAGRRRAHRASLLPTTPRSSGRRGAGPGRDCCGQLLDHRRTCEAFRADRGPLPAVVGDRRLRARGQDRRAERDRTGAGRGPRRDSQERAGALDRRRPSGRRRRGAHPSPAARSTRSGCPAT